MKTLIKITLAMGLGIVGTACTKKKPYDTLPANSKVDVQEVATFKPQLSKDSSLGIQAEDYIMMVSNIGADRISPAITYYKGYSGKVRFDLTEEGELRVVSIAQNFTTNPLNDKVLLQIPVTHVDYRCAQDDFGKCTNTEEEDSDKDWYDKKYIKVDLNGLNSTSPMIDVEFDSYLRSGCTVQSGAAVKDFIIENNGDAMNIVVERTFTVLPSCLGDNIRSWNDLTNPRNLVFTTKQNFSFAKLKDLVSPDYRPMQAALASAGGNSNEFGFFLTEKPVYDSSNNIEQRDIELVNRWNPNKKSIVYYLGQNFNEPRNKGLKDATYHAANLINHSLEKAGAKIRLELRDPDPNIIDGDVRYSQVLLAEDPITRGLLGYGPVVANPDTGEILTGRVAMYSGIIKKTIRNAYNDVIQLAKQEEAQLTPQQQQQLMSQTQTARSDENMSLAMAMGFRDNALAFKDRIDYVQPIDLDQIVAMQDQDAMMFIARNVDGFGRINPDLGTDQISLSNSLFLEHFETDSHKIMHRIEEMKEAYIKQSFYPVEMFNAHSAIDDKIQLIKEKYGLKPWLPNTPEYAGVSQKLSEAEKQEIIDLLVPALYVPTLVHEWGHNLGLRHNFAGSTDKDNWYAHKHDHSATDLETSEAIEVKEDIQFFEKLGIKRKIEYSSIMDYAYGTMNELNIMGKYDVAALRFAYGFAVDPLTGAMEDSALEFVKRNADGQIVEKMVASNTPEGKQAALAAGFELRDYAFCTDEGVSLNATCNRFDEGTNYSEVSQHYIDSYEENYHRRNLRNGRRNFDIGGGDIQYLLRTRELFRNLRLPFEFYELIKNKYNIPENDPQWLTDEFLSDVRQAAAKGGRFFLSVITTPDAMCRISPASNPTQTFPMAPFVPLAQFGDSYAHCGEVQLNPLSGLIISGQAGKSLNSRKSRNNPSSYIDEVDVRGIWIDKLLAAQALFTRDTGMANDEYDENYLHLPELRDDITNTLDKVLNDQHTAYVNVSLEPVFNSNPDKALGGMITQPMSYSLVNDNAGTIKEPLVRGIGLYFGLPKSSTSLQKKIADIMKENAEAESDVEVSNLMANYTGLETVSNFDRSFNFSRFISDGGKVFKDPHSNNTYIATKENVSAQRAITFIEEIDPEDRSNTLGVINKFIDKLSGDVDPDDEEAVEADKAVRRQRVRMIAIQRLQAEAAGEEIDMSEVPSIERKLYNERNVKLEVMFAYATGSLKDTEFYLSTLRNLASVED
tara:strand:+ start:33577 stop:37293 length:3717 start_codon:yes stop_codon:yes gene_type:complete